MLGELIRNISEFYVPAERKASMPAERVCCKQRPFAGIHLAVRQDIHRAVGRGSLLAAHRYSQAVLLDSRAAFPVLSQDIQVVVLRDSQAAALPAAHRDNQAVRRDNQAVRPDSQAVLRDIQAADQDNRAVSPDTLQVDLVDIQLADIQIADRRLADTHRPVDNHHRELEDSRLRLAAGIHLAVVDTPEAATKQIKIQD